MTIEKFIEKIKDGGWNPSPKYWIVRVRPWGIELHGDDQDIEKYTLDQLVLSPKAWEAVGKVEKWSRRMLDVPRPWLYGEEWFYKMHQMIDALADGKTPEEFIKTL